MADYRKVGINMISLGDTIVMDDVSKDDSVNPRNIISASHVDDYEENIVGYLNDSKEFSKVWGQNPEVVEADDFDENNPKYLLASGYHTVTALLSIVDKASVAHAKNDRNEDLSEFESVLVGLDLNFDVIVHVKSKGKLSAKNAAKYHAAFSNNHGIQLSTGEKTRAAYNALSQMNLTSAENDPNYKPHMPDRTLAALLGVGKSTVYGQRQVLIEERHKVVPGKATDATTDTSDPKDALDELSKAAEASATDDATESSTESSTENTTEDAKLERQDNDGKDQKTDDRPKGAEGVNVPQGESSEQGEQSEPKSDAKDLRKETLNELNRQIELVMGIKADPLSMSISTMSTSIETGRERLVAKLMKNAGIKDGDYSKDPYIYGIDLLFSAFITMLDVIATENDKRP